MPQNRNIEMPVYLEKDSYNSVVNIVPARDICIYSDGQVRGHYSYVIVTWILTLYVLIFLEGT